jgi:hypothetical protein
LLFKRNANGASMMRSSQMRIPGVFAHAVRRCKQMLVFSLMPCSLVTLSACATIKYTSPYGEAGVYLLSDFSNDFDVAYRALLKPGAKNKSWSALSILLIGSQNPGPCASVAVASNPPHHRSVFPFTFVAYPSLDNKYESHSASCARGCLIELRGDANNIYAYVAGKLLHSWLRSDLRLQHPYIQLNAEAHGVGDSIEASLTPVRGVVAGRMLSHPTCGFEGRGIEAAGIGTLIFRGKASHAGGTFINLLTRAHQNKC